MICPYCGAQLPRLTPATPSSIRYTVAATLRAHSRPHARVLERDQSSPEDLGAGSWVLGPNRRTRVWQPA